MTEDGYSDGLISLTGSSLHFRHYYFPRGSRTIELSDVERIEVLEPTLRNGKWRIHGTGDLRTWFARDPQRPQRDRIFLLHLRGRWRRIGFTAEHPDALVERLRSRGVAIEPARSRADAVERQ